jgi:hypothetical protein
MPGTPTIHHIFRGLTQRLPNFIGPIYRDLKFETGEVVPTMADLAPGVEQVSEDVINEMGEALILGDAMDIPMVEVGTSMDFYPTFMVAAGYYFSFKSVRSLEFAGTFNTIADRKLGRVARAIAERCHRFSAVGDARFGQRGFLNSDLVPVRTTTFDPSNVNTTAKQLRDFLMDAVWFMYKSRSGFTRFPSEMLISPSLYEKATTLTMADNSSMSVLQSVLNSVNAGDGSGDMTVPYSTLRIMHAPECAAAYLEANGVQPPGTAKDRIVVYSKDPLVVHRNIEPLGQIPLEFLGAVAGKQQFANFQVVTPTIWSAPAMAMYMDVPLGA